MTLTIQSYSRFNLYLFEPSSLRPYYRVDLDEVHDAVSNAGFDVSYCPQERKKIVKSERQKFIAEQHLAILNAALMPFKALKKYIESQFKTYILQKAELNQHLNGAMDDDDLFSPFIEPRILVYKKLEEADSERFLKKFVSELEDAFKTMFTLFSFDQKELNKIIVEILNLRRKNRLTSN